MSALALSSGSSSFEGGSFGMIHLPSPTFCLLFHSQGVESWVVSLCSHLSKESSFTFEMAVTRIL